MKVPCKELPKASNVTEVSLVGNTHRLAMHPTDEFTAYSKLIDGDGMDLSDVAERFGKSRTHVKQRLSLGRVSPKLLGEYRKGKLNLQSIMAFTLSEDHERQLACYTALSKTQRLEGHLIKSWLTGEAVTSARGIGKFVGKAAYTKAGGALSTDLFEDVVYLSDTELVGELALKKLTAEAENLKAEGWAWVCPALDMHTVLQQPDLVRLQPQLVDVPKALTAKIDKLEAAREKLVDEGEEKDWPEDLEKRYEAVDDKVRDAHEELDRYLTFTAEQKATSGCFVGFDHGGELAVKEGVAHKKDVPQPKSDNAENATDNAESKPAKKAISAALERDLGNYRQQATKAALVAQPALALEVLYYSICLQMLEGGYQTGRSLLDLNVNVASSETSKADIAECQSTAVLNAARETLNTEWLAIKDEGKRFEAFCSLSKSVKEKLVAFCVASSLTIKVRGESKEQDYVVDALAVPFAKYWRPTKENYLARVSAALLVSTFAKARGAKWVKAAKQSTVKKGVLVADVEQWLALPEDEGQVWIPEQF